jgi:hypothetical protein
MKTKICDEGPWFSIVDLKVQFFYILNYMDVLKIH